MKNCNCKRRASNVAPPRPVKPQPKPKPEIEKKDEKQSS